MAEDRWSLLDCQTRERVEGSPRGYVSFQSLGLRMHQSLTRVCAREAASGHLEGLPWVAFFEALRRSDAVLSIILPVTIAQGLSEHVGFAY